MTHTQGIPRELVTLIQKAFNVPEFIETGTYMGKTAKWAAGFFPHVTTIERSKYYYDLLLPEHQDYPNVEFVYGHSSEELGRIVPGLGGAALFWLDGHWSGEETYGEEDECPLLKEIEAITRSPHGHFILIDDARLFLSPPPHPHKREAWPDIGRVLDALRSGNGKPYILIFADVIIACPAGAADLLAEWHQEVATRLEKEWVQNLNTTNQKPQMGRMQLLAESVRLAAKALLPRR